MIFEGIIQADGSVLAGDGKRYLMPTRGADDAGYPKVLMDAKSVGGRGSFGSQSIKDYIGMRVKFECVNGTHGWNYEVIAPNSK